MDVNFAADARRWRVALPGRFARVPAAHLPRALRAAVTHSIYPLCGTIYTAHAPLHLHGILNFKNIRLATLPAYLPRAATLVTHRPTWLRAPDFPPRVLVDARERHLRQTNAVHHRLRIFRRGCCRAFHLGVYLGFLVLFHCALYSADTGTNCVA